ncbi:MULTISPECIES: aldo/keto reductase [unclassified Schaalia]|uniref:aldo/keto reductase n=1 Tax=unclassified Schaalia TaxID=2691889 RepID=UPI0015F43C60|nr:MULTISPECIES: aldo/keto reductase [unclassified Schaalia]
MRQIPTVTTRSGVMVPQVGFGTYKVTENTAAIVTSALEVGYRHVDTAQMYGNETEVGEGWRASGLPREDIFLTSKLNNPNHAPEDARRTFEQTLIDLQTDYVDLFLIHWPVPMHYCGDFASTWAVLEEFAAEGRARSIGVSNFEAHHLEQLFQTAKTLPEVNQIESHPYFAEVELHAFNAKHGIVTEAWSPLARGTLLTDPVLERIGKEHGRSPSQVALRWGVQRGDIVLPKSSTPLRQRENLDLFGFELSDADMREIYALDRGERGRTGKHPDLMDRM